MAPYRQSCSACVGRSATALHDMERYRALIDVSRTRERLARERAARLTERLDGRLDGWTEQDDAPSWEDEAAYHAEAAASAERRLWRARRRLAAAFLGDPCVLCGGTGYLDAPGTFVLGAKGRTDE